MTSVYIFTTPEEEKAGRFKVGIHTGDIGKLIKRYITSNPMIDIKLFVSLADGGAKIIENKVKERFSGNRIENTNGNVSEWFQVPLKELYLFILPLLPEIAPTSSEEDEKKIQEERKEIISMKMPIKNLIDEIEKMTIRALGSGHPSSSQLLQEIRAEKDAVVNETFRGDRLLIIRKLIIDSYRTCTFLQDPYYGEQLIRMLDQITVTMNDINKKFPDQFKKIPQITKLSPNGTSKDDLLYRRSVSFNQTLPNNFIQRHWDEILKISPHEWPLCNNLQHTISPEHHYLSLKKLLTKLRASRRVK